MTEIVDLNPGPIEFVELQQGSPGTTANASGLKTLTTTVSVSGSTAPTAGQILTASDSTTASWQSPSIVGITGTKAQFDTAVTDGNFMYVGDTAATVTTNANLTGHVTSIGNAATLGSFTLSQLNTAVSDYNVASIGSNNEIALTSTTAPTATSSGTIALFANSLVGKDRLSVMDASGDQTLMQASFLSKRISYAGVSAGSTVVLGFGESVPIPTGTATTYNFDTTNKYGRLKKIGAQVTTPAVNAIAGWRRGTSTMGTIGGSNAGEGGFFIALRFSLGIGVSNTGKRIFAGLATSVTPPTDVEPSTQVNIVGMGCDAADTNLQFFNNDGSGTATKTDLGASFPIPLVDETSAYDITMYSPAGTSQVIYYTITDLISGSTVSGSKTTNIPSVTTGLTYRMWMGSGANSREVGINFISMYFETNY